MKHLFYLIGIFFIIYEFLWIISPQKQVETTKKFLRLSKQNEGKVWSDYPKEYKNILYTKGVAGAVFTLWMFGGLLTFNWLAFFVLLVFNFLIVAPLSKLFRFSIAYIALNWLNSIIGFAFGLFVIVNSYHLKIDLYQLVKAWYLLCAK